MAIDDLPSARGLAQISAERLQNSPDVVQKGVRTLAKLLSGDFTAAAEFFGAFHDAIGDERSEYLLRLIVEDLGAQNRQLQELSARHQQYLATDWLALLADADRKARQTRAKERIQRMAQIIVGAAHEPIRPPDETEEATRIAMELTDEDVVALRAVYEAQHRYENQKAPAIGILKAPTVPQLPREQVLSHFGKLQGLGLIIRAEDYTQQLSGGAYPSGGGFFVLERGKSFLRAIAERS
jgi:hypothetical protein